jgi:hypothetical protein
MKRLPGGITLISIVLLALLAALAGCGGNATTTPGGMASMTTAPGEYRIQVYRDGAPVGTLDLEQLHSLAVVTFSKSTGEPEEGPTLLSALALLGITDFTSVTVEGLTKGRVAAAELTLQRSEVTDTTILEFNKKGKTKLAGKDIPEDSWIVDVAELRVE